MIFRPAIIAHPSHELSPAEHHLSQDVLEFLIKHQDWFMLDIPPPPTSSAARGAADAAPASPTDLFASSDEEMGGWKLVGRDGESPSPPPPRAGGIGRRRTTTERSAGEWDLFLDR